MIRFGSGKGQQKRAELANDRGEFRVWENLATTPGDMLFRRGVREVIQRRPPGSRWW